MSENNTMVCYARSIPEVLYQIKTVKDLQIVGGCSRIERIPDKMLPVFGILDLTDIERHERYLDIGPAVTINQLLALGESRLPPILYAAAKSIANPTVRNIATVGGNICAPGQKLTLYAPLLALGARLEFQNGENTLHQQFTQFSVIPKGYILTKIRVPTDEWDISIFRRLGPSHRITGMSASYAFMATTENSILTKLRIAFAGQVTFRSTELENRMQGTKLPLAAGAIAGLVEDANRQFDISAAGTTYEPIIKQEFLKLAAYSFKQLT